MRVGATVYRGKLVAHVEENICLAVEEEKLGDVWQELAMTQIKGVVHGHW